MKYKIGQRMFHSWECIDEEEIREQEDNSEIVCIALLGDGTWKYGVHDDCEEYYNQITLFDEKELEKEFTIREVK